MLLSFLKEFGSRWPCGDPSLRRSVTIDPQDSFARPRECRFLAICSVQIALLVLAMRERTHRLALHAVVFLMLASFGNASGAEETTSARPNIVVMVADDWSWPHAGVLGDPVIETPNFDRIANEGVLAPNTFVSTPSCTPSRLSILTGQHHWRLREGDSLGGSLREEFPVYTELLRNAGYRIGRFGKGVWPSEHSFRERDSFGERYRSFDEFLAKTDGDRPFCYWHGGQDPHRPYELNVGQNQGMDLSRVKVPACLPDDPVVRGDVADYLWEVQRFDRQVGDVLAKLEEIGELENTLVVVTSDNGMPFPRCKATLYDSGTRVPLAIRWGNRLPPRVVKDYVSLCDLAPTFLEVADVDTPLDMTGTSLVPLLLDEENRTVRTVAFSGNEKHVYLYPSRSIRTPEYLYIRNWDVSSWPSVEAGDGRATYDFAKEPWPTEKGAFSFNIDPSPTKQLLRLNRDQRPLSHYARLAFDRPGKEELYDLSKDPDQLNNVADDKEYREAMLRLRRRLDAELIRSDDPRMRVPGYRNQSVEGWPVRVSERLIKEQPERTSLALKLLEKQLKEIAKLLPAEPLNAVMTVPIWLSPEYEGVRPTAEYHPGAGWLARVGRRPELVHCVELTNIRIFEREYQRMPMMILHELAHAYHHQVLSFEHPDVVACYEQARRNGSYDAVLRGNGKIEKAYGMNDAKEYFAETSEAFFGKNDFFPFDSDELEKHDPRMFAVLTRLWEMQREADRPVDTSRNNSDADAGETDTPISGTNHPSIEESIADGSKPTSDRYAVGPPPAGMNLDPFYKKYTAATGYPIVASEEVNDFALKEAAYLIDMMLKERPDVRQAMIDSGSRMIVMGYQEYTTDIPEYAHMRPKDFWDARARGLGGSRRDAVCSCAEENVLAFPGDPYSTENILIHEFAHNIHLRGMVNLDPTFQDRLQKTYQNAMDQGLWKGKYASTNAAEYFAEGVQSWFDDNRPPDHDHNHVDTREELREYDPGLAAICKEVFGTTKLVYTKPQERLVGHLEGYDPGEAPTFVWPDRLRKAKRDILEEVKQKGDNRQQDYKN